MIEIAIDDTTIAVGEMLTARIHWTADGGRPPRRIIVAAEWETDGAGDVARGVGRSMQFVPQAREESGTIPVRLLIPYEGPISYNGQLITIIWKLCVRIDQWGVDECADALFQVAKRGRRGGV